jgi:hypothetical protein
MKWVDQSSMPSLSALREFRDELPSLIDEARELSTHEPDGRVCAIVEEAPPLPGGPAVNGLVRSSVEERARSSRATPPRTRNF